MSVDLAGTGPLGAGLHAKPGVVVGAVHLEVLRRVRRRLGFDIVLTSGERGPLAQAAAWRTKIEGGYTQDDFRRLYRRDDLVDEVFAGELTLEGMAATFKRQIARGDFISAHMVAGAVDLRIRGYSDAEIEDLVAALEAEGVYHLVEKTPPHIHCELGRATDRRARPSGIQDPEPRTFTAPPGARLES